jgi:integrase
MPDGKQRRKSFGALEGLNPYSITDAKEALAKRTVQKKERRIFDILPETVKTFNELSDWYLSLEKVISLSAHNGHVFTYTGKPIRDIRDGLKNACKKAEIPYGRFQENGFIFHDLRRTAKTNARKSGVDKNVRMTCFGYSSGNDMDYRYDIVDEEDLIKAVDQMEAYLEEANTENVDHSVDQKSILDGAGITTN